MGLIFEEVDNLRWLMVKEFSMQTRYLKLALINILLIQLITPGFAYPSTSPQNNRFTAVIPLIKPLQGTSIRIKETNPVVNENNRISLTAVDANGQPLNDVTWETGSPDIATVDPRTGEVRGLQRGFATITARRGSESFSSFVVVTRVSGKKGPRIPGDMEITKNGQLLISDPTSHVLRRKNSLDSDPVVFAGRLGMQGRMDGMTNEALLGGPTALTIDNARGAIFIADTLNHSIRRVDLNSRIVTVVGSGAAGTNTADVTPFSQAVFKSPRGLAADLGGNLFVSDTDNHAIYYIDFARQEVRLVAGNPGVSGLKDGRKREALFLRPTDIDVTASGRGITVCDTGNGRYRQITRNGDVSTIGAAQGTVQKPSLTSIENQQAAGGFNFVNPRSISSDSVGNLYVVDDNGAFIITRTNQVIPLAQPGSSFGKAESVVVRGTDSGAEAIVLDSNAASDDGAIKTVTVGRPQILSLSQDSDGVAGGAQIIINGRNFAPESQLLLADNPIDQFVVESATRIRFTVPAQNAPGRTTLTVTTRGGIAQAPFFYQPPSLDKLTAGQITTIAGGRNFVGDGGLATNATLFGPAGLSVDAAGKLFIADLSNQRVRSVDPDSGTIVTVAGSGIFGNGSPDGIDAITANFTEPIDIAFDSQGNLYTNDFLTIVRVDINTGKIKNLIIDGITSARAFAFDSKDNLYIADVNCNCIRRLEPNGNQSIFAGTGMPGFSGDNGPASKAQLQSPTDIAIDLNNNIYICDSFNNRIRKIDSDGIITTVAGNGRPDFTGDGGLAVNASLAEPRGVAVDARGNIFIADSTNHRIRRVDTTGIISTVVGSQSQGGFSGDGGLATEASLNSPKAVAVDGAGNIFISDEGNNRVRMVTNPELPGGGIITTFAGQGALEVGGENIASVRARLVQPSDVAFDARGNVYIAEVAIGRIRAIDNTSKLIQSIAGLRTGIGIGDGGPALDAFIASPTDLIFDKTGNLIVLDNSLGTLRRITAPTPTGAGIIERIAGGGDGFAGESGMALMARFDFPQGLTIDKDGNIYIADTFNHRIRRIDTNGNIDTIAGSGATGENNGGFAGDNGPARQARLNLPTAVALDSQGNIFIGDSGNLRIRRVDARTKIITTIAGTGELDNGDQPNGDGGPATQARFSTLIGDLVFDAQDNLFIADTFLNRIRRIDRAGIITRVAGKDATSRFAGDGGPALEASFGAPRGLALDSAGNLYITDLGNNAIRVIKGVAGGSMSAAPSIVDALFKNSSLFITGNGFGTDRANVNVNVNGQDISNRIKIQTDTSITLKGNKKRLNLGKGANQVTVTVRGVVSNTFMLNLFD
ncbi:MAG: Ig-like domain-containing protein [Acidobacteriota bacterium]